MSGPAPTSCSTAFGVHENVVETRVADAPLSDCVLAESLRRIGADLGVEVDAAEATEFGESVGTSGRRSPTPPPRCDGCNSGTG